MPTQNELNDFEQDEDLSAVLCNLEKRLIELSGAKLYEVGSRTAWLSWH